VVRGGGGGAGSFGGGGGGVWWGGGGGGGGGALGEMNIKLVMGVQSRLTCLLEHDTGRVT